MGAKMAESHDAANQFPPRLVQRHVHARESSTATVSATGAQGMIGMFNGLISRRDALGLLALGNAYARTDVRLSSFSSDVSPRIGGPLFNAVRARAIVD